jgi:LmbE family N-acetylglucosaminyl deacetylase
MRTALVIIPHADDAALFLGGTLAKRAAEGWRVIVARITNDARDSVGLSAEETVKRNSEELREAASILGVDEVVDLGYEAESLADVSEVELRGQMVYLIRKYRPYAVFSFDPHGLFEPNLDHIRAAQAVEEAFWIARFDLPYPEHFEEGLKPFAVCEQWYWARRLPETNHVEDITEYIGQKIDAGCAHRTMLDNILNQCRLLVDAWDGPVPDGAREALASDPRSLVEAFLTQQALQVGEEGGLGPGRLGEAFRVVRFGDMAGVFEGLGFDVSPPS